MFDAVQLRSDQIDVETRIYHDWNNGARNVLAVAPTGWGKSVLISEVAMKKHALGSMQVKIAHRNELVGQLSGHIARRGIKHRIIAPQKTINQIVAEHRREFNGQSFVNPTANCSVAGIDTLIARKDELRDWAMQQDHWTIDEAHHVLRLNKWGKGVDMFPNAVGLGVTASPSRADRMGLGRHHDGVFDTMVLAPDMRAVIDMGNLCDYEIVAPETDFAIDENDFSVDGDLSPAKGRAASKKSHIVGDVVQRYIQYAYGKRGIVFATDVETAMEIADNFNACGIIAAAVSAKTPSEVRNEYIRRFRDGRITILVNVDLFGEGFDVPAVEVVIMARPTASLAVYLQQFGRALRRFAGKLYGLVIDLVSNFKRHGFPDKKHYWTLDRGDKKKKKEKDPEEIELTVCRSCTRPFEKFYSVCPHCGTPVPLPAPGGRSIEVVEGNLLLLDRDRLAEMRAATNLESPASVAERVAHVAGQFAGARAANNQIERHAAQQRLSAAIAQWAGVQRSLGRPDDQSYKRIYLTTGVDVLTALTLPRADMESLAVKIEGWYS